MNRSKENTTDASILVDDLFDPCEVVAFESLEVTADDVVALHELKNRAFLGC